MREARLILPSGHRAAREQLQQALAQQFGGFTATPSYGGWIAPDGTLIRERGEAFDVAMHDDAPSLLALRTIADSVGRAAHQQAIYLRLPDGTVEIRAL